MSVISVARIVLQTCNISAKCKMNLIDCRYAVLSRNLLTYQRPLVDLIVGWIACLLCWLRVTALPLIVCLLCYSVRFILYCRFVGFYCRFVMLVLNVT